MIRNLNKVLLFALVALLVLSTTLSAFAQSGWDIRVSQISAVESPDAMILKTYFNVYDPKTSLPILDTGVTGAQIALPQSAFTAPAEFKKPDVPIYIVFVLDASGSMGGAAEDLKKAAKLALNNTPDNAFFSVVQFNEEIKLLQDFTQNIPAVSFAIDQYRVANKGTCLYDATYSAAEALQKAPPGRRAIILFTDGKDENASGKPCSKHTYLETSEFAQSSQIPVNTIGISFKEGALNEVELRGLAASTGGFSAIAKSDDMSAAFQNIMDGLKAQWMVETLIYPRRGKNEVVLTLNLKDNQTISTTFTVESNTEYPGPPSPVTGQLSGLEFKAEDQTYDIQVAMTSPELVQYVKVAVWDAKAGSKVAEYQFDQIQQYNTFNIPTDKLVAGRDYELRMIAVSKKDQTRFNWSTDSEGKKLQELVHTFAFDPSASLPMLEIQSVTQQGNDLQLAVTATNSQLIGGFDGWLLDEATNTKVPNSNFKSDPLNDASGNVLIPLDGLGVPSGKYTIIVRVLGQNQQVYSAAKYSGVVYEAKLPNLFKIITTALLAAPLLLFLIVAIILAVVGFLIYLSMREKSLTGTPVLQGRMGAKLTSGKAGPVIPVADDEPIPPRSRMPAAPAVPAPQAPPAVAAAPTPNRPAPSAQETLIGAADPNNAGATLIASAPLVLKPTLTITQMAGLNLPGGPITVDTFPFVLGRTEGALIVPDGNVSRRHAQITYDAQSHTYYLTDLTSSNGTYLNNQKLVAGQPVPLPSGAVIGLGLKILIRFELS